MTISKPQHDFLWLMLILMFSQQLPVAAENTNLYQASILVNGRNNQERANAFRLALTEVIKQISGRQINLTNFRPEDLTVSYHYENRDNGLNFVVNFDPAAINRLLNKSTVSVRKNNNRSPNLSNRPATLLWLIERNLNGNYELANTEAADHYQILINHAKRSNISLTLPIIDSHLENLPNDQENLITMLRAAAKNYSVNSILIGIIENKVSTANTGDWIVNWHLLRTNHHERWDTFGSEYKDALINGITELKEHLKTRITITNEEKLTRYPVINLIITEVKSLLEYGQLMNIIRALPEIIQIWPSQIEPNGQLTLKIETKLNLNNLANLLKHTGVLKTAATNTDSVISKNPTLYYQGVNLTGKTD